MVWNWVGLVVSTVISLAMVPFLIGSLGPVYYGLWVLVAGLTGYYGLLDLGIASSLQRFVARATGCEDQSFLHETFRAALFLSVWVAVAIFLISFAVASLLPSFIRLSGEDVRVAHWLVVLFGSSVALAFPTRSIAACLRGLGRFDYSNFAAIITASSKALLTIGAVRTGLGVLGVAAATVVAALVSLVVHVWLVRRADCTLKLWARPPLAIVRQLLGFSFYVFVRTIGDQLRFQTDSLVIARWLGTALVTPFSVAATLMSYFMTAMGTISGPVLTSLCNTDAAQSSGEAKRLFLRTTKATAAVSVLIGCFLIGGGKNVISAWVGEKFAHVYPVLVVLTLAYVVDLGQGPSLHLTVSRAKHQFLAYWTFVEGLLNVTLSIWLVGKFGLLGVAIGTAVPMLITKLVVQPWYVLKVADVSLMEYLSAVGGPLVSGAIVLAGCAVCPIPAAGWQGAIVLAAWVLLAYSLAMYLSLSPPERREIASVVPRLFAIALE